MKKLLTFIAIALMSMTMNAKEKLRVLYVGGTSDLPTIGVVPVDSFENAISVKQRMADFSSFLRKHFTDVKTIEGKDYLPEMSSEYDVTVFDSKIPVLEPEITEFDDQGRIIKSRRPGYLPNNFSDAAVFVADMSEVLGRTIGSKNDWFCLCLDNYALGWNKEHQIFKGPFKVDIKSEMLPTPSPAFEYAKMYGYSLSEKTEMWKVHAPVNVNTGRIGMVSRPWGYLDSPDTEIISGGKSAKSIDAIAIGRHGNLFHWGFAAKPSDMTPAARAVFANSIVYMKDFKGAKRIAHKINDLISTRAEVDAYKFAASPQCNDEIYKMELSFYEMTDSIRKSALDKKNRGESLSQEEEIYIQIPSSEKPVKTAYSQYLKNRFPELYPIFGTDKNEYQRYFDNNRPYFRGSVDGYGLTIDQEARDLGIANNDIRILDKAIELLENGGNDSVIGKTLLERYTLCRFESPAEWKAWLSKNRDRMFFTESGGWLWLVDTNDSNEPGNNYSALNNKEKKEVPIKPAGLTDRNNPVALNTEIVDSESGRQIVVTMTLHPGFHAYALVDDEDPFIPTEVEITLPDGWEKDGDLQLPSTSPSSNSTTYYKDTCQFRQSIKGKGQGTAVCAIKYQVCDDQVCFPPTNKEFRLSL